MRLSGLVCLTASLSLAIAAGCNRQEPGSTSGAGDLKVEAAGEAAPEAPPAAKPAQSGPAVAPKAAPSAVGVAGDPGAKDAVVGSWASAEAFCNSGEAIRISRDGTYGFEGEDGTWSLDGDTLKFENVKVHDPDTGTMTEGDASSVKVTAVTDRKLAWESPGGQKQEFVRCPGVN